MKLQFQLMPFIVTFFMTSCSKSDNRAQGDGVDTFKVTADYRYTYDDFKMETIKPYLDSLNLYKPESKLPHFLFDKNLDATSKINDWPAAHFVSIRQEIFNHVTNAELLNSIISEPYFIHQFDTILNGEPVHSGRISYTRLALERLKTLKENDTRILLSDTLKE